MFYAQEQIGKTRYKTPEGYLLCLGAVISRAGSFEYAREQAGIEGGDTVMLTRTPEELFSKKTMASFEGKPITIGHERFVTPENFKETSCGTVLNVRRGTGEQDLMLLADMLICDAKAIEAIESEELKELSIGFDALVQQDDYGEGHQYAIVGNHVALVPNARCGRVCTFGDEMGISIKNMIRRAFRDGDIEKLNDTLDKLVTAKLNEGDEEEQGRKPQDPDEEREVVTAKDPEEHEQGDEGEEEHEGASVTERLDALEKAVAELKALLESRQGDEEDAPAEEGDPEGEDFQDEDDDAEPASAEEAEDTFEDAEELTGEEVKRPTCDARGGRGFTRGALRRVKAQALKKARVFGDAKGLTGRQIDVAFSGAVSLVRQRKNPMFRGSMFADGRETVNAIERINKLNAEYWAK